MSLITDWISVTASNNSDFVRVYAFSLGRCRYGWMYNIHVRTYKRIHYRLIINFVRIKHYKYPRFGHWIAQRRNIHPSRGKRINGKSRIFYILKYSRNRKSFMFQKIIQYFLLNMKDLIIAQVLFRFHSQKNFFFIKSVWINKNHFNTIDSRWVLKNYFSNRAHHRLISQSQ